MIRSLPHFLGHGSIQHFSVPNHSKWFIVCLLALMTICSSRAFAQELSVDSFRSLENDLTANTYGTIEYDQNGDPAALIKVVTTETGFVFSGGMLGIVKTVQQPGEIWVYVPFGLQRITIAHPDFGVLRDYYFPVSIDKARTYELRLKAVRPARTDAELTPVVNVTFDNPMENSGIFLSGVLVGTGSWSGQVAATDFLLEVKQEGYVTYSTTITFAPDELDKTIPIPPLEPIKGVIRADSDPADVNVYMDGILKGRSPLLIENLKADDYNISFRKRGYRPYYMTVSVRTEETYKAEAVLKRVNNNVYAGVGYQTGHLSGIIACAGIYLWNLNIEASYLIPSVLKERIWWVTSPDAWTGKTRQIAYDYAPAYALKTSVGYGIPLGKHLCLTGNIGAVFYRIEGECSIQDSDIDTDFSLEDYGKDITSVKSGHASLRMEYSPIRHLSFTVVPSYEFPLSMGDVATTIDDSTDLIRKWCKGASVQAGMKFYF